MRAERAHTIPIRPQNIQAGKNAPKISNEGAPTGEHPFRAADRGRRRGFACEALERIVISEIDKRRLACRLLTELGPQPLSCS
jgi:hypothetical protein